MNNATPFIQSVRNVAAILKRLLALIWTVITKLPLILPFTIKSAFVQLAVKSETASEFPLKSGLYQQIHIQIIYSNPNIGYFFALKSYKIVFTVRDKL